VPTPPPAGNSPPSQAAASTPVPAADAEPGPRGADHV
jgi:hypothetical protein